MGSGRGKRSEFRPSGVIDRSRVVASPRQGFRATVNVHRFCRLRPRHRNFPYRPFNARPLFGRPGTK
jgi:hypothetical protein